MVELSLLRLVDLLLLLSRHPAEGLGVVAVEGEVPAVGRHQPLHLEDGGPPLGRHQPLHLLHAQLAVVGEVAREVTPNACTSHEG